MKYFLNLGYCAKCGDTIGPWIWCDELWLCEQCGKEFENAKNGNNKALAGSEQEGEQDNQQLSSADNITEQ